MRNTLGTKDANSATVAAPQEGLGDIPYNHQVLTIPMRQVSIAVEKCFSTVRVHLAMGFDCDICEGFSGCP